MAWAESWERMDPYRVLERKQERAARTKQGRAEKARQGIESLFKEPVLGRKLDISPAITTAMYQWGKWADRKQYWENLNATPFCKLLGIGHGREAPDIRLDPESMAIHKAVMRIQCGKTKLVLAGYYVREFSWDDKQEVFINAGISRKSFYELLKTGSVSAFNAAKP